MPSASPVLGGEHPTDATDVLNDSQSFMERPASTTDTGSGKVEPGVREDDDKLSSPPMSSTSLSRVLNNENLTERPTSTTGACMEAEPAVQEEDDKIWMDYSEHAHTFDRRMIDNWAKIVDVILVYIALFLAALSAFTIEAIHDFHPNPGEVTNQILIAIYNQTMNASHPIDLERCLRLDENALKSAFFKNVILFSSLAIAIIIAVLATMAKIWIIRYDRKVNAPNVAGPPRSRAMKRQETYDGSQSWGLGKLIEILPIITMIPVYLFGLFILDLVNGMDQKIGFAVVTIFQLGLCYLFVTSFCGAFISDSPFRSSISFFIKLIFNIFPDYRFKWKGDKIIDFRLITIILTSLGILAAIPWLTTHQGIYYMALIYLPLASLFALMAKEVKKDIQSRRRHSLPFATFCSMLITFIAYSSTHHITLGTNANPSIFYGFFVFDTILFAVFGYMLIKMSKIKPDTTAINAIAWMLKTSPYLEPTWFQKAVQIAGHSQNFRVLLLELLLPLADALIFQAGDRVQGTTLAVQDAYLHSLENLVVGLSHRVEGNLWRNEAPIPSKPLRRKLEELKDVQCPLFDNNSSCAAGCPHSRIKVMANGALEKFGLLERNRLQGLDAEAGQQGT